MKQQLFLDLRTFTSRVESNLVNTVSSKAVISIILPMTLFFSGFPPLNASVEPRNNNIVC